MLVISITVNLLIRNLRYYTDNVKCYLFRATALACIVVSYGLTKLKVCTFNGKGFNLSKVKHIESFVDNL